MSRYLPVIGIEVHIELSTASKIFCSCPSTFGAPPNTCVCPVCMGLPGALPVLNGRAVDMAIAAGLATGCKISKATRFDRKNYFYPDLPKAYQISQQELPLCFGGGITVSYGGEERTVRIRRIHLEEDAGKLIHGNGETAIDYNRCGIPLIEIVSEPDIHSPEEARAYLTKLRELLLYTGISDCRMSQGSMRCDLNVSLFDTVSGRSGTRTEIKNVNSFAFAARAIEYEIGRQTALVEAGEEVRSVTLRYDEGTGRTVVMRPKETSADYRFLPEPDMLSLEITEERIEAVRSSLPQSADERRQRYTKEYDIIPTDADIILTSVALADYFEEAAGCCAYPKLCANLLISELLARTEAEDFRPPVAPSALRDIAELFGDGIINSSTVKRLIDHTARTGETPRRAVAELGWAQINDRDRLEALLLEVRSSSPKLFEDYIGGKTAARKAIIGKAMGLSGGKANPVILNGLFDEWAKGINKE